PADGFLKKASELCRCAVGIIIAFLLVEAVGAFPGAFIPAYRDFRDIRPFLRAYPVFLMGFYQLGIGVRFGACRITGNDIVVGSVVESFLVCISTAGHGDTFQASGFCRLVYGSKTCFIDSFGVE